MTTIKEMMEARESGKERGAPSSFSKKGNLLVRDEGGSFHKSSFEKIFAFNSRHYHPYKNLTPEEKQRRMEHDPYFGRDFRYNSDRAKDLSPMQIALVNAKRAQVIPDRELKRGDVKLRGAGNFAEGDPGRAYDGVDEYGLSVTYPATEADKIRHMADKMERGRKLDTVIGGVTKDPNDDWHDIKPRTEMAQHVIDDWGLTPEGGKLDEPKSETRRKEEEAREEARQEWIKEHWEPEWSPNYREPSDDYDYDDDDEESDDDE